MWFHQSSNFFKSTSNNTKLNDIKCIPASRDELLHVFQTLLSLSRLDKISETRSEFKIELYKCTQVKIQNLRIPVWKFLNLFGC